MITTYYTNIKHLELSQENIGKLSPQRQEKLNKLIPENSKKQCLGAGLLIDKFLPNCEIKVNQYGKPYIENGKQFNIAHSDDYVIMSIGNNYPVGCDIERVVEYNYLKLGKVVFHKNEMKALKNAENIQDKFFQLWTKKEAFLKCIGTGFHTKASKVDLDANRYFVDYLDERFRFKEYTIEDYKISVCSQEQDFAQNIKEIKFE